MLDVASVRVIPAVPEQGTSWWLVGGHFREGRLIALRLRHQTDPHNPPDANALSAQWGDEWKPSPRWTPVLVWASNGWQAEELAREACQRCGRVHTDDAVAALGQKVDPNGYELTRRNMQPFWCRQAEEVAKALAGS